MADPLSLDLNLDLDLTPRRRRRQFVSQEVTPSLIGAAGRKAIGGLSAVGNLLDLPGSMVRDAVNLKNPLDQLLDPLGDSNRTTGRDLLRKGGLAGKRDTMANWAGGVATEVALDPLTYLTFGGSALGKAGKLAKGAGALDDVAKVAAKKSGRQLGLMGGREARLTSTLDDLMQHGGPEVAQKLTDYASRTGQKLSDFSGQKLGGLVGVGLPFMDPIAAFGTGARSVKAAKALDTAGRAVRFAKIPGTNIAPVHALSQLFDPAAEGVSTAEGLARRREVLRGREVGIAKARGMTSELASDLAAAGYGDDASMDAVRRAIETKNPALVPQALRPIVDKYHRFKDADFGARQAQGIAPNLLDDQESRHAHRFITEGQRKGFAGQNQPLSTGTPSRKSRKAFFADVVGGTESLKQIYSDPGLNVLIDGGAKKSTITRYIKKNFAGVLPEKFLTPKMRKALQAAGGPVTWQEAELLGMQPPSTYKAIGRHAAGLSPETRQSGLFGNHPLADFEAGKAAELKSAASAKEVFETLVQPGILKQLTKQPMKNSGTMAVGQRVKSLSQGNIGKIVSISGQIADVFFHNKKTGLKATVPIPLSRLEPLMKSARSNVAARITDSVTVGSVFKNLKIKKDEGVHHLADLLGMKLPADPKKAAQALDDLSQARIDKALAKDLLSVRKGFDSPEAVGQITGILDSVLNFTKGMWTTINPSFHGRNLFSGTIENVLRGQIDQPSVQEIHSLLMGKAITGAKDVPMLQQLAQARGIVNPTDEQASDLLRELMRTHDVTGKFEGQAAATTGRQLQGAGIEDIFEGMPGKRPFSYGRMGKKLIGREKGTTLNPLKAEYRGVGQAQESTLGPMAAGQDLGYLIESVNRGAPFWYMLKQGIDPGEAAKRVGQTQVKYGNRKFTKFEQQLMTRIFPFYKFTKGKATDIFSELTQRPGGRTAQTIRAINRSRQPDELTPDYVSETASIPLGTLPDGSKRYVTGLGLMMEGPLSMASPSPRQNLLEMGSQLNPLLKAPLEYATGETFFQRGPTGGRELDDLDPVLGRTLANVLGREKAVKYPGDQEIELLLSNSPLSTLATKARQLTDPRKGPLAKAVNQLTGVRVSDISPAAQDALLREQLQEAERTLGAKTFTKRYFRDEDKAEMTDAQRERIEMLERLRKVLEERAKQRARSKAD